MKGIITVKDVNLTSMEVMMMLAWNTNYIDASLEKEDNATYFFFTQILKILDLI